MFCSSESQFSEEFLAVCLFLTVVLSISNHKHCGQPTISFLASLPTVYCSLYSITCPQSTPNHCLCGASNEKDRVRMIWSEREREGEGGRMKTWHVCPYAPLLPNGMDLSLFSPMCKAEGCKSTAVISSSSARDHLILKAEFILDLWVLMEEA